MGGLFEGPFLGGIIYKDDSKSLLVAQGPLKVIHQRPLEIAPHIDALLNGIEDRI